MRESSFSEDAKVVAATHYEYSTGYTSCVTGVGQCEE